MPSSVIADFSYDAELSQLTVTFVTGRVYRYYLVPADCAAGLDAAPSKGAFFNQHIRDKYPFREVTRAA
jgi:lysyl-tRNA synthetase class 2